MAAQRKKTTTRKTFRRTKTAVSQRPKVESEAIQSTVIPDVVPNPVQAVPVVSVAPPQAQPSEPPQEVTDPPLQQPQEKLENPQGAPSSETKPEALPNTETVVPADSPSSNTSDSDKPSADLNPPSDSNGKKNFLLSMIFIVLLGIAVLGGVFLYRQISNKNEEKVDKTSVAQEQVQVTPEPTREEVDLSKYEIKILNGSGVAGEAGKQQGSLETEGFTVASVGNADSSDYEETLIQAKKSVDKEFLDKLKEILEKSFTVGKIEVLDADEEEDVVVVIGSKTSE